MSRPKMDELSADIACLPGIAEGGIPLPAVALPGLLSPLPLPSATLPVPPGISLGNEPAPKALTGPYAYAKSNDRGNGVEYGAGLSHYENDSQSVIIDGPGVKYQVGEWQEDGAARGGIKVGGAMPIPGSISGKATFNQDGEISGDIGVGTFSAEASAGENGAAFGMQLNALEGSVTNGKIGTSDHDEQIRVGGSIGEGAAVRAHWGDKDADEYREYGFGFDLGPLSMDLKTEDPLRSAMTMAAMATPLGMVGVLAAHYLLPSMLPDSNLTDQVAGQLGLTTKGANLDTTLDVVNGLMPEVSPIEAPFGLPDTPLLQQQDQELPSVSIEQSELLLEQ